jgi:hypothetical protein
MASLLDDNNTGAGRFEPVWTLEMHRLELSTPTY